MITYTWKIGRLITLKEANGQQNVVVRVRWICRGTDGTYNHQKADTCSITFNENSQFTSYENLTEQDVLNWIWNSGVDKNATESIIDQAIQHQIDPPYANLPLPWNNNEPI